MPTYPNEDLSEYHMSFVSSAVLSILVSLYQPYFAAPTC